MQHLFESAKKNDLFYTQYLEPLFFDTLNKKREELDEDCIISWKNYGKVPFLNGGLFEKEDKHPNHLALSWDIFNRFFEILNNYNFTIIEDDPDYKEVAVDPEMLGHIFENLLEDNKDKGAFYTPKEIVQYMCQESLIEYLFTKLSEKITCEEEALKSAVRSFVINPDYFNILNSINQQADRFILEALHTIKVCDPAIGSGAFPMGILHEIFRMVDFLREGRDIFETTWGIGSWNAALVKEEIIQNSIYGVDIEKGAVDIARLRFWLSIIIDEEEPKPLPNLDYKIMQGNSLLERFGPVDLMFEKSKYERPIEKQSNLFGQVEDPQISIAEAMAAKGFDLTKIKEVFFHTEDIEEKEKIRKEITEFERSFIADEIKAKKDKVLETINTISKKLRDNNYNRLRTRKSDEKELIASEKSLSEIVAVEEKSMKIKEGDKPYFLWKLYFMDVFDRGGFDVIIGNPPYVRADSTDQQKIIRNQIVSSTRFLTLSGKWDLYIPFIEISNQLINKNGLVELIIPDAYCHAEYSKKSLQFLTENKFLRSIDYFPDIEVFEDVGVRNVIISYGKNSSNTFKQRIFLDDFQYSEDLLDKYPNSFRLDYVESVLSQKSIGVPINSIMYISKGIVGNSDEKKARGEFKVGDLLSSSKNEINCRLYYEGKDIAKWRLSNYKWIEYGTERSPSKWSRKGFPEFFKTNKIVTMRSPGREPRSFLDYDKGFFNESAIGFVKWSDLINVENKSISKSYRSIKERRSFEELSKTLDLLYLLGVMNSKLIRYELNSNRRSNIHIYPDDWRKIKIPIIPIEKQLPIIKVVKQLIEGYQLKDDFDSFPLGNLLDQIIFKLYELDYSEILLIEPDFWLSESDYNNFSIS